jgi:hypothetical protein
MRRSGLVVPEEATAEGVTAEIEQAMAEGGSDNESEEDNNILSPTKPSHIEFEKSTVTAEDFVVMTKVGNFGENEDELIRFAGEEVILEPKKMKLLCLRASGQGYGSPYTI